MLLTGKILNCRITNNENYFNRSSQGFTLIKKKMKKKKRKNKNKIIQWKYFANIKIRYRNKEIISKIKLFKMYYN